ncbi:MAG: hypothetical protein N5P05_003486 [Chroococcopsis gigantea SAG 12.99]|jgi:TRAP transporter TAXI family solute receptor|nr:TAXI family TRAP transporter solute-binding subunit [Chlorogloea purpurea SAG 13.99]MDV3001880.1 hypothetical protein [Chroococcopsis gigantea SAG 12.99]
MQKRLGLYLLCLSLIATIGFTVSWYVKFQSVKVLHMAVGMENGELYQFARSLAEVVNRYNPKLKIGLMITDNPEENARLLGAEKVDLALIQTNIKPDASSSVVSFLYPQMFHLVTIETSKIKKFTDLKNKSIATLPEGTSSHELFLLLCQHYDLSLNELKLIISSEAKALKDLDRGNIDAVFFISSLHNPAIRGLLSNPRLKLIGTEQGSALQIAHSYLLPADIPRGIYNGAVPIPDRNLSVVAVSTLLMANSKTDYYAVYNITQIIQQHRQELAKINGINPIFKSSDINQNLGLPVHPGAEAYYERNRPNFWLVYSDFLALLLSIVTLIASRIWQLNNRWKAKQKNRADFYNLEVLELIKESINTDNIEKMEEVKTKLFSMFEQILLDLDNDRITSQSFQSFSFTWQVALSTLRHREMILLLQGTKNIN